jgi:hypothetical protein
MADHVAAKPSAKLRVDMTTKERIPKIAVTAKMEYLELKVEWCC